jgi:hypothetical protein
MVTVDVVGVEPPPPPPPPPQPVMTLKIAPIATKLRSEMRPRRFLKRISRAASGSVETGEDFLIGGDSSADPLEVIVRVSVAAVPAGVSVVGAKEQVAPIGNPEQAKLTGALKPY